MGDFLIMKQNKQQVWINLMVEMMGIETLTGYAIDKNDTSIARLLTEYFSDRIPIKYIDKIDYLSTMGILVNDNI